jgi:cytochrome c peroxidase
MGGEGFLSEEDWQASSDSLGAPKAGLSEELDALAAYLETLDSFPPSPHRNADGTRTDAAVAGQVLFESAALGCSSCHPSPNYTDSSWLVEGTPLLHDVGTLSASSGERLGGALWGIDTPTLRGVWASGPYFHDGAARSVRDVLDQHGHPIPDSGGHDLSEGELDQLEAFLLQLE